MEIQDEPPVDMKWIETLKNFVQSDWHNVVAGEWDTNLNNGTWSTNAMRGWCLQLYAFIHAFPKFLAEAFIKVEDEYSRSFLIDNIRVEKTHAEHWLWMGEGLGIPRSEMMGLAQGERPLLRDVQSLTDWIWYINAKGSLAEAVAATSFAIEGATGDLSRTLLKGFEAYGSREGVNMNPRTTKGFRNPAKYDDDHPRIALETVARYATTERMQTKVMLAAKRSIQLLDNALRTGYQAYSVSEETVVPASELRAGDKRAERRKGQQVLAFPERRFIDRRGRPHRSVA